MHQRVSQMTVVGRIMAREMEGGLVALSSHTRTRYPAPKIDKKSTSAARDKSLSVQLILLYKTSCFRPGLLVALVRKQPYSSVNPAFIGQY